MKFAVTITTPEISTIIPVALLSGTFKEKVQKASSLGFDGVELMVTHPRQLNPEVILQTIYTHDLEVAAISTGALSFAEKLTLLSLDPAIEENAFDRLIELIDFAKSVSAPLVTIGSFRGKASLVNFEDDYWRLIEKLKAINEYASSNSVRLVLEPLNRYEGNIVNLAKEAIEFTNQVHQNLGILLDTYHVNIEEASITDCFNQAAIHQRLWHVHIGDSNRFPPGMGHFEFPKVFSTLSKIGYEGFISAELLRIPDADKAAALTMDYCKSFK